MNTDQLLELLKNTALVSSTGRTAKTEARHFNHSKG